MGIISEATLLEIIIGLGTVIIGTLAADKYESYRSRAIIEITPAHSHHRLGFALTVKRRTLNHPLVLFHGGFTRPQFDDLHKCDLYDADGNVYKEDFIIAGGQPVYIYPMVGEIEWVRYGDGSVYPHITVTDSKTDREVYSESLPVITNDFVGAFGFPKEEPKPSDRWYASIQVIAEGLERQELQRFHLALRTFLTRLDTKTPLNQTLYSFDLLAKREPYPWRWV